MIRHVQRVYISARRILSPKDYQTLQIITTLFFSNSLQVIAANGEREAARSLKEASEVMSESPSALQLRYLQTLNTISAEKNSTIIFPIPIDMVNRFLPS